MWKYPSLLTWTIQNSDPGSGRHRLEHQTDSDKCSHLFPNKVTWFSAMEKSDFSIMILDQLDIYIQFSSVVQSCLILCDPMNCSTPSLPVHHQLPESTQTHVHWISDAIQPSHPLSSPSPPVLNLSQHQDLFKWVSSSHQVAKGLEFQLQHIGGKKGSWPHLIPNTKINSRWTTCKHWNNKTFGEKHMNIFGTLHYAKFS